MFVRRLSSACALVQVVAVEGAEHRLIFERFVLRHKDWLLWSSIQVPEMKLVFSFTPISSYISQSSVRPVLCENHFTNPVFLISCPAYLFHYYVSYSSCPFLFFGFFSVFFPLIHFVFHLSIFILLPTSYFLSIFSISACSSFFFHCFTFLCLFSPVCSFPILFSLLFPSC